MIDDPTDTLCLLFTDVVIKLCVTGLDVKSIVVHTTLSRIAL